MCRGKLWLLFLLIGFLEVAVIKCWTHTERMAEDPLRPGKCYNSEYHLYIRPGESVGGFGHNDRRFCKKLTCARLEDDGELNLIYSECPFVNPKPGCTVEAAYNEEPFPICCSYLNCPVTPRPDSDDDDSYRVTRGYHRIPSEDDYDGRLIHGSHRSDDASGLGSIRQIPRK